MGRAAAASTSSRRRTGTSGPALGILDFERGAKIAGARFTVLTGAAARLSRALVQLLARPARRASTATGRCCRRSSSTPTPSSAPASFPSSSRTSSRPGRATTSIPTAEVPLTNLHRDEILRADALPLRYTAYTPCFRAEAGAAGRDTRGMIRQHQFDKVEIVMFSRPEDSAAALETLTGHAEDVLRRLGLPYRVVSLCTGDLGFASAKTYDLEVWLPGMNAYKEISSCSNFEAFQARRAHDPLPPRRGREARVRAHAERLGPPHRPDDRRDPRELPARRRLRRDPGGPAALHARPDGDPPALTVSGLKPLRVEVEESRPDRRLMRRDQGPGRDDHLHRLLGRHVEVRHLLLGNDEQESGRRVDRARDEEAAELSFPSSRSPRPRPST